MASTTRWCFLPELGSSPLAAERPFANHGLAYTSGIVMSEMRPRAGSKWFRQTV
jgi:hypothetical protein